MKTIKNRLIVILAIIGVCAVLYDAWHYYRQQVANEEARALFAAPASSGIPDVLHATPGSPPPQ